MGGGQGGGGLLDQAEAAGAERLGTRATLGLDDVGASGHEISGELLLLVQGQHVGDGHAQDHLRQQFAGAAGDGEHLSGIKDATQGVEGVVVTDLDHGGTGGHRGGEQLRIDGAHADGQTRDGGSQLHQLGVTGHVDQISTTEAGCAADALNAGGVKVGEASNHLESTLLGQGRAKGSGQPIEAGHASTDGFLRFSHAGPGRFRLG